MIVNAMTASRRTAAFRPHIALACLLAVLSFAAGAAADECRVDTTTSDHPLIEAVFLPVPPIIDGLLTESVWDSAACLDDFWERELDRAPSESTVVWLAYDETNLYFAARCYDSHPEQIKMEQTKRGNSLRADDYIAVGLDIEHQHRYRGEYVFRVNPRGTQDEHVPDGSASKVEWRGDWRAAAHVDSLGWTAEWAVPFAIFNRPPGKHTIGVTAFRRLQRTDERIVWPNTGKTFDRTKSGDWVEVEWPEQRHRPVFMPYLVGQYARTTDDDGAPTTVRDTYLGLDMKYTTMRGVALVGTIYPDFRNVENDILGLDFSYTERYRRDRRPFFEEGRRYFPESWIFYSNRIEEIYGGTKAFGQLGNHRLGIIDAYDKNRVNHAAVGWYWQPITRLEMENKVAWRHGPKSAPHRDGTPYATDNVAYVTEIKKGRAIASGTEYYRVQGAFTATASDTGNGYDIEASYDRFPNNGAVGFYVHTRYISRGFMPIDGLFDLQEANLRNVTGGIRYNLETGRKWFRAWGVRTGGEYGERQNGDLYTRSAKLSGWVEVRRGTGVYAGLKAEDRPPYEDRTVSGEVWWKDNTLYSGGGLGVTAGRVGGTDYYLAGINQGIHPVQPLSAKMSAQWRRRDYPVGHADKPEGGIETQYQIIVTAQYDITTERAVSGRVIYSHDGVNGYTTYRQVVRKGLDLFLIIGDPSAETWTRRVAVKAMFVL